MAAAEALPQTSTCPFDDLGSDVSEADEFGCVGDLLMPKLVSRQST